MSRSRRGRNRNYLVLGDNNVISDLSGFKYKASEMRELGGIHEGLVCHESEYEEPQPQLEVEGREDDTSVSLLRPRQPDVFVNNEDPSIL